MFFWLFWLLYEVWCCKIYMVVVVSGKVFSFLDEIIV